MEPPTEDVLADLALLALAHGVASVEYGGPLIPFVIAEIQGERVIHRFLDEQPEGLSMEGSVARARAFANGLENRSRAWVLAYEGQTPEGPAIVAEATDGAGAMLRYAQPYRPKRPFRRAQAVGSPIRLDDEPPPAGTGFGPGRA